MKAHNLSVRTLAVLLAWLLTAPAWLAGQSAPVLPNPGSTRISHQDQEKLGLQAAGEVYKQMPVLPDSHPLTRYVQQLGKKLETVIPDQYSWPYQFHVVEQKDVNAFALPGGPIFINVGTIQTADNEAQLAGVMAHEMSHVYMQHSAKAASKQQMAQIFSGILGAVLPGSTAGDLARVGIQVGAGTVLLKYSRGDEAQADAVGAIIMYKAGYNPRALSDFFKKLEGQGGSGVQFLSDHPNPGNREAAITKEIRGWPAEKYLSSTDAFARAKQEASGVKAYTAQEISDGAKQGLWVRQNREQGSIPESLRGSVGAETASGQAMQDVSLRDVQPSDRFRTFQQQNFSIAYPENWQAGAGNGGVTIAPQAGVVQNSVAYGVIISESQNPNAPSLDQTTESLIQGLQRSNPGLERSGSVAKINVHGMEGRSMYLSGQSPLAKDGRPLPERDWLVVVPTSAGVIYVVFVAPERDFSQLQPVFEKMLDSLYVI